MGSQVKRSDIAEDDIFKNIRDSAKATIIELEKINAEFKQTAITLEKGLTGAKTDTSKGLKDFNTTLERTNKLTQEAVKVNQELEKARALKAKADQEVEKINQQKLRTTQMQTAADEKLLKEEQKLLKEAEKRAQTARDEANAYKQLSKNTAQLKANAKELAAEMYQLELAGKKDTKEFREMAKTLKGVTLAANQGDQALKKIDKSVGDNFRNVGNYEGAVNKLRNGLGQLGLAFGIGSVVSSAGKTIVEFDQKVADLVSITGAGGKDLEFFKQQAIEMGKGVEGGASAVIEAYKLIGSAKPELLNNAKALDAVTQSAITLSQASGMTLPESATALTDAMNQFGAPAEKAGQFIDALANGALLGSAEIPQVTEALLKFGAVAKGSNVSVEESVALIETLAEKGLKGAEAGTALRNVMLKISAPDALPKEAQQRLQALGISFEDLKNPATSMADKLALLKPLLKDNASMVKIFGLENTVSATNLIENTDRIEELTKGMGQQGTASKQAEDRTKTLSFAFNQLKESWNALVLELSSGEGTSAILVEGLSFIAKNLGTIVSIVGKAVLAWAAYKTIQKSIQAVNFVTSGGLKTVAANMMEVFKAGKQAGEGAKVAGQGVSNAGKAMTAVPWMAIIAVVVELGMAFYDMASGADDAARAQRNLNKAIEDGEKFGSALNKTIDENFEKGKRDLDLRKSQGKLTVAQYKKELQDLKDARLSRLKYEIQTENEEKERAKQTIKGLQKYYDDALGTLSVFRSTEQVRVIARFESATEELRQSNVVLTKLNEQKKSIEALEIDDKIADNTEKRSENSEAIKTQTDRVKEINVAYEKTNEYLTTQTELLNELSAIENERSIKQAESDIQNQVSNDIANISEGGTAQGGENSQYLLFEELINKKYELITKFEAERLQIEVDGINERYRLMDLAEIESAQERRDKLLAQEGITSAQKKAINDQYDLDIKTIDENNLQRNSDRLLEIEIAEAKSKDKLVELEVDKNNEIISENDKLIDAEIDQADKKNAELEKKTEDSAKKNYDTQREFIKLTADYFINKSNEKIAQLEKEISAAENQYKVYEQLAINGNITAKESLAEQQKLIVEANRKKEAELKKQQRIKLAQSVYEAYTGKVESGSKNPLVDTIKDITLLNQFISSLPTFYEGTDTTVSDALGKPMLSGRDGHVVRVDGSEKILNPKLSAMTGDLTTSEIAKIAMEYNNGKLISKGDSAFQIGSGWSSGEVIKKLDELGKIISDKPEQNIEVGRIVQGAMEIVHSKKKGNSIIYNKYRVR